MVSYCRAFAQTDGRDKEPLNTHMKKKLVRRGFEPQSHIPLSQTNNNNTTCTSAPFAKHEIREPADVFEYDRSESSPKQLVACKAEEHPDLSKKF